MAASSIINQVMKCALFGVVLVVYTNTTARLSQTEAMELNEGKKKNCSWTCLTFAQMWPGSFCMNLQHHLKCNIPDSVDTWTIHGLWPSHCEKCCTCWHLFKSDLEDLKPQLLKYWPTLINRSSFSFWETEWTRHGTCAACNETMNSPAKYFGMGLKLWNSYNIDSLFSKAGIVPSCDQAYQLSNISSALKSVMGEDHELQCLRNSENQQFLVQIKVTLFKNFSSGCKKTQEDSEFFYYKPCDYNKEVYFVPIDREKPEDPCS
ncbi:ribonuclease Oy-like [Protopterus annectens]|uniref:ribonuclease Oy-like n=1 Tax=Protopterus annectens TaxID=7888 RepID=UPI001CFAFB5C|nr:ribonuclease Oy-like [Protopterus annectens]